MSNEDMTEGRARYYREVELKHGRAAMLGALGFLVSVATDAHPRLSVRFRGGRRKQLVSQPIVHRSESSSTRCSVAASMSL
eukprot:6589531-Prymnesium_polylepis.1